jgi:hypothetical protein
MFGITLSTFAQERHTITLTCQSSELTEQNINDMCRFGQSSSVSNKDYTIEAQVSDIILWNGKYAEPGQGYIDIVSIDFESGTNIFKDRRILDQDDGLPNGTIVAIVKKGEENDEMKYKITFDAYNRDGDFISRFKIDPKIKIRRLTSNQIQRN